MTGKRLKNRESPVDRVGFGASGSPARVPNPRNRARGQPCRRCRELLSDRYHREPPASSDSRPKPREAPSGRRSAGTLEHPLDQGRLDDRTRGGIGAVASVTITVSDMDRALDFYEDVLTFEKVSEVEVTGEAYKRLIGVFVLRMRVARMRLGDEFIELMEVMTPKRAAAPGRLAEQ
jgi:Glyoxalase/Bleomycin resistance protein/Dioxygenase superfamily